MDTYSQTSMCERCLRPEGVDGLCYMWSCDANNHFIPTPLQPTQEGHSGKAPQRSKPALENSTGSDRVSSFSRPVKRTFSLSRKPPPHGKSIHGSSNSLENDPGYSTMPSRRTSPSFRSVRHYSPSEKSAVMRTHSLRTKPKKRPKLHSLTKATSSVYVEHNIEMVLPNTTLEESGENEHDDNKLKKNSFIRRSNSFRKSKSKSPIPHNSVLGGMHMYTVAEELARQETSKFARLSKLHLQHLELGSASFETSLAIDMPKKDQTTFRTPVGMRGRPVSALDMQLVAMRNDSTAALRSNSLRSKQTYSASEVDENQVNFTIGVGPVGNGSLVTLRKRTSLLSSLAKARPVSASFIDPPTVRKIQAASQSSLHSHSGSLTDLMMRPESPMSKYRPKRPAPQAPSSRSSSRNSMGEGSNSGRSTPKSLPIHNPLTARRSDPNSIASSNGTLTGTPAIIPNGRVTPNSPVVNHRNSPVQRNTSSPQLPMIPIHEDEMMTSVNPASPNQTPNTPNTVAIPQMTITSPPRTRRYSFMRQESLYISPRKQSLTINAIDIANSRRLRASQILQTGGITEGDLSSSRMDLLAAIRKGIQLKKVQKKEEKKNNLASMPWDVAAILERRLVLEMDTDSSEDDIITNDEEWEDD